MHRRVALAAVPALLLCAASCVRAAAPASEQRLIDALIAHVAAMNDARFVRNGRDYAPADAAQFMREKYKAMGSGVDTADAFIERIATKSSMSGRPYLIRRPGGREQAVAPVLREELARLRAAR